MTGCVPNIMGANASAALMKEIGPDQFPPNERYFGLHNFGNTCYCNSILQALFFCPPFREKVLQYRTHHSGKHGTNGKKDTLLACLCELFYSIVNQKKKCGVLQPKKFLARLRKEYESFDNYMQHDAHELFNHLLNSIHLVLVEEKKAEQERKKQLELQTALGLGSGIKRERLSIFSRIRRGDKELRSMSNKVGGSSFISTDTVPSTSDSNADEIQCIAKTTGSTSSLNTSDSPASTYDAGETVLSNGHLSEQSHGSSDDGKPSSNGATAETTPTKGFRLFSRSRQTKKGSSSAKSSDSCGNGSLPTNQSEDDPNTNNTWINDIFQGTYTTMTRCLTCETVKTKDEDFLDLSVDIEQNTSITHCLRVFSNQQTLSGEHKYSCEVCRSKQEAQIQMRIKKLPTILALHLKRFKYCDQLNKYTKLSYRVVFPFELRLFNTTDDASNPERLYDLIAVVVHCGSGPYRGHYVSIVKSHGMWLLFDDDSVEKLEPSGMEDFYGVTTDKNSESGYILFYQSKE